MLLKLIKKIGTQAPDHAGGTGRADDDDRNPDMLQDRLRLRPAHRFGKIFLVHQVADRSPKPDVGEIHEDQGQHEIRDRDADEPDERQAVIAPAILVRGGIEADREGDDPGEDDGDEGDEDREPQAVADDVTHRQFVLEGVTEIALEHSRHPVDVTQERRLVEAILLPQRLNLLHVDAFALRPDLGDVALEIIARRQLDDGEDKRGNNEERRDHDRNAP